MDNRERYDEKRMLQKRLIDIMPSGDFSKKTPDQQRLDTSIIVSITELYTGLDELIIKDVKNDIEDRKARVEEENSSIKKEETQKKLALEERRVSIEEERIRIENSQLAIETRKVENEERRTIYDEKLARLEKYATIGKIVVPLVVACIGGAVNQSIAKGTNDVMYTLLDVDKNSIITNKNTLMKWNPIKVPFL